MAVTKITNLEFGKMVQAAADKLGKNAEFINSLNVFPVPDGDTGTNMTSSMASGAKYERNEASKKVGDLSAALAKGLLMGARGNSGVILSQIFRGFAKATEGMDVLSAADFVNAYANGAKTAYKAVMKPTEGTILTVVRESAQEGLNKIKETDDLIEIMHAIYEAGEEALKKTPELLPVLKEVGVVDSGGQGLVFVLQAFDEALSGRVDKSDDYKPDNAEIDEMVHAMDHQSVQGKLNPEDIKYTYCTQMLVRLGKGKQVTQQFDYDTFYNYLADLGDSLLVLNDDQVVRVHVHTEHPGKVLSWGQQFGDLQTIEIHNMVWQQEEIMEKDEEDADSESPIEKAKAAAEAKKDLQTAVIAVASGEGIAKLLKSLGVTHIITGGQTMNPSTQDILDAINNSGAKQALVLPNNGNIFMTADQAAEVADIPTKVVHSKTIAQAMSALLEFNPEASLDENLANMEANTDTVASGAVTNAVRDTTIDGREIKKDDYMGIVDGKIVTTDPDLKEAAIKMVKAMLDEDSEIVTILFGTGGDQKTAEEIKAAVEEVDDELDIQIYNGGQPVYPYLISVE
ncbi:DAK2 domain-containing protein [Limosilactobacillus agrestis]|uniref:DAK2 domain-containing protein n=1 Tax=Limosilactobacillus agrestis TaxID=2759748 RepID=A0ABS8R511_9LACO|nr:DAK2 domain-containing protein [Limosilactobacillus agrestis]MBB1099722.1 DAK2 domain-containing protein [Limosilactobacillus agrestis]MCD7127026.1 DAK2 domain-containing protein [Limosilactobacillus agrestis]MCD7129758.1 DAK2 domain-containing protein [Limosilactobacillus agrestis]